MTGRNLGWRNTNARFLHWYPAVADVSVRSGWFWKPQTDGSVKSPDELMRIYENSVGRNAGLQINIAPDARGRIPDGDAAALKEFGERVRKYFAVDLAAGDNAHVMDSEDRLGRRKKSVAFSTPVQARYLVLQEDISKGQRVEFAEVTVTTSSGQRLSYPIKSIGWKRIIELREEAVKEIEVTIHKTRGEAHVRLSVY